MKKRKRIASFAACALICTALTCPPCAGAAQTGEKNISYTAVADSNEQTATQKVVKYGMVPIYARDIKDGTYAVDVASSSPMFNIVKAALTVKNGKMTAVLTLHAKGYLKLFMGTGKEAAKADLSDYIDPKPDADGRYTYQIPVEALNKALDCAAFSKRREKWYDRKILIDAASLPEDALKIDLPDYDLIESALIAKRKQDATDSSAASDPDTDTQDSSVSQNGSTSDTSNRTAVSVDRPDGEYSIEVTLSGGSGKAAVNSPALMTIRDGKCYARLQWSSSNYDYMIVGGKKYENTAQEGADSVFEIPILAMDQDFSVIADTTAMGTPHEISYTLTFYQDSIGSKNQMPQEAAKRVLAVAAIIIVGGGILNHIAKRRRRS